VVAVMGGGWCWVVEYLLGVALLIVSDIQ